MVIFHSYVKLPEGIGFSRDNHWDDNRAGIYRDLKKDIPIRMIWNYWDF